MKLFELKVTQGRTDTSQQWVKYKRPDVLFFPKYSNSLFKDLEKFHKDKGNPDRNAAYDEKNGVDYSDRNSYGWFMIDDDKKIVNLDMTKYTNDDNRRPAGKMSSKNYRSTKDAYPVLGSNTAFNRIVDMIKALKAVVKHDSKIGTYKIIGDDRVEDHTVNDVINGKVDLDKFDHRKAYETKTEEITLFHGTSSKRAKTILKSGLRPGNREESYGDLIDGYSEHNIYLTFNPATAANYATREAINDTSNPVILAVTLNKKQFQRLLSDEDSMSWYAYLPDSYKKKFMEQNPLVNAIWDGKIHSFDYHIKNLKHNTKRFGLKWLRDQESLDKEFRAHALAQFEKFGLDSEAKIEEAESQIFMNLMKTFLDATHSESLKKLGNVAYPGPIPASQIKMFKSWEIKGTKLSKEKYTKDQYNDAIDQQQSTVKRH